MKSSLEGKTVRPGLLSYSSYYHSTRQPVVSAHAAPKRPSIHLGRAIVYMILALIFAVIAITGYRAYGHKQQTPASTQSVNQAAAVSEGPQECQDNTEAKHIVVSVHERHLWACEYHKVAYNTPVITGMEFLPADLTPRGTYKVSDKQTNTTLTGQDSTGSWNDPVYYWMPFLQNQYGTYGFHDATWRPNTAFGNVDPNSKDASHGCVELPLGASKWLYNWTPTGTTVTVKD